MRALWLVWFISIAVTAEPKGPFSHKAHASLKLRCATCHAGAEKDAKAGLPVVAQCKTCHVAIAEITSAERQHLADFVNFDHGRHAAAKIACASCHGDAYQQSAGVEKPMRMKACVECHKQHKATIACNVCHELGQ